MKMEKYAYHIRLRSSTFTAMKAKRLEPQYGIKKIDRALNFRNADKIRTERVPVIVR